jgi:ribosomal protein S18 acetylase RimI-like enzyme
MQPPCQPYTRQTMLTIRRASHADAAGIAAVLEVIASERIHSAIDRAWTVEEERRYIESLSPRETIHVAVDGHGIVGLQVLDRWSPVLGSMAHVGQVGTFLLPAWRGRGVGRQLWRATLAFAREAGYRKLVIQVRSSNTRAQAFYRNLGFRDCGRLTRQVVIDGVEDDEVLMELLDLKADATSDADISA